MRVVLISDTHGARPEVPQGDVLVHCGDLTHFGTFAELRSEVAWLKSLPFEHVVLCPGNHDICCHNLMLKGMEKQLRELLSPVVYLRDSGAEIAGKRFYGSPWVPQGNGGEFISGTLQKHFAVIPENVDCLITHCPPFGILDKDRGEHFGSSELSEVVSRVTPRVHAFGHVHSHGVETRNGTTFYNAAKHTFVSEL